MEKILKRLFYESNNRLVPIFRRKKKCYCPKGCLTNLKKQTWIIELCRIL